MRKRRVPLDEPERPLRGRGFYAVDRSTAPQATLLTIFVEWSVAAVVLILASTLMFCVLLQGPFQPDPCRTLQGLLITASDSVTGLFGQ